MTKDFATFDCDAHVTEPPLIWERAAEYLTHDELAALKTTIWWDEESRQLIVNGRAGVGIGSPRRGGIPGTMRVISNAGPGVKHDIQRALNVRNLNAKTALTQEQVGYVDFGGSYEPEPRLRDMDVQGIDQVMIIPTDIDTYPWLLDAVGTKAFCKAYNHWAYEYTKADPDRLFFAALLPMQNAQFAVQEVYRTGLPRRAGAAHGRNGQLSVAAEIRTSVGRAGGDRHGLWHAPVPGRRDTQAAWIQ
jgi:hypothetical protein